MRQTNFTNRNGSVVIDKQVSFCHVLSKHAQKLKITVKERATQSVCWCSRCIKYYSSFKSPRGGVGGTAIKFG